MRLSAWAKRQAGPEQERPPSRARRLRRCEKTTTGEQVAFEPAEQRVLGQHSPLVVLVQKSFLASRSIASARPASCAQSRHRPLGLAFQTPRGCRRDRGKLYGFHEHLKKAGIKRRVRWYDLRHTCVSSLVAGWWGKPRRLEEVRDLLGHSSVEVTERYAWVTSRRARGGSDTRSRREALRGCEPGQLRYCLR